MKRNRLQDPKDAWVCGFSLALADIHRQLIGGNDSKSVCAVARAAGVTLATAKAAGVSSFDLKELRRAGVR